MMQTVATGRAGWTEDNCRDHVSSKIIPTRKSLSGMPAPDQLAQKMERDWDQVLYCSAAPTAAKVPEDK